MIGLEGANPFLQYFAPVSEDFSNKGTIPLGVADTGQSWSVVASRGDSPSNPSRLTIIDGMLTNTVDTAESNAGYITANLGNVVKTIRCQFAFLGGSGSHGGTITLAIWKKHLYDLSNIPDATCHMTVTDTAWAFGVFVNGVLVQLATDSFASALATDGTIYNLEVVIEGTTATIHLPDGTTRTVTDARVSSGIAKFACFEVYQNNSATDPRPMFKSVFADII